MSLTATVAYPYDDRERGALALRGELRRQVMDRGVAADWSTLTVQGPTEAPARTGGTDTSGTRPWRRGSAAYLRRCWWSC